MTIFGGTMIGGGLADPPRGLCGHIGGLIGSPAQLRTALRRYFRPGLLAGEHCVVALDDHEPAEDLTAIGSRAELTRWQADGLLTVRCVEHNDRDRADLTVDEMLDVWRGVIELARVGPVRIGGQVSWWLHQTSADRVVRYERELNLALPNRLSALCLYDLNRFDPHTWPTMLDTHPTMLVGDDYLTRNRYFRCPDRGGGSANCRPDLLLG